MKTQDELGEEVRKIREKLGFKQKDLAEKLQVSNIYLSYIEQGKKIPSEEFLENIYKLSGLDEIPERVFSLISSSKEKLKKKNSIIKINAIYLMEEKGIYNFRSLKLLLDKKPKDIHLIYAMMVLLLNDNKKKEAEQHLLDSLMLLDKPEERKWLQASFQRLEGDFEVAIQLMLKSLEEFEKSNSPKGAPVFGKTENNHKINDELKKKKSLLLFQTACMYFDYGQSLYNEGDINKAKINFKEAALYHHKIRENYNTPYYQMDYSSIFFWLAFLGENPKENWIKYINEAHEALKLNYYEGINNLSAKNWTTVFSKPFIISTISFISRSYAELALIENSRNKQNEYIEAGEKLFIQTIPIDIDKRNIEYYRFYFNHACFYSIKAEIKSLLSEDYSLDLQMCFKSLQEANRANSLNMFKFMEKELESKEGLQFLKKERSKEFQEFLKSVKKTKIN